VADDEFEGSMPRSSSDDPDPHVNELRVVYTSGTPRERGRAVGSGFPEEIGGSVEFYRRYFGRRGIEDLELQGLLAPFLAAAEGALPDSIEVLRGMAEAADVPFDWLFAANTFEEIDPLVEARRIERCTAFVITGPGTTILAHNEQWLAGDAGCAGIVVDRPEDDTAIVSPTVASWLPAVGLNQRGRAQAVMSLVASDEGVGVPRVLVSRHALGAADREDAIRRAAMPGRSGGYAYLCAAPGGASFLIETSAKRHAVLEGVFSHTNHYLDPGLAAMAESPSPSRTARQDRLSALLAERRPETVDDAMEILRDHLSPANPICAHPGEEGEEGDAIVFSMVCDLEAGRMWVAPGNPCESPFEEFDVRELVARV
jgi:isopenicillin-N N-acyltransferase like protein